MTITILLFFLFKHIFFKPWPWLLGHKSINYSTFHRSYWTIFLRISIINNLLRLYLLLFHHLIDALLYFCIFKWKKTLILDILNAFYRLFLLKWSIRYIGTDFVCCDIILSDYFQRLAQLYIVKITLTLQLQILLSYLTHQQPIFLCHACIFW